jgi:hypothetical protein
MVGNGDMPADMRIADKKTITAMRIKRFLPIFHSITEEFMYA